MASAFLFFVRLGNVTQKIYNRFSFICFVASTKDRTIVTFFTSHGLVYVDFKAIPATSALLQTSG